MSEIPGLFYSYSTSQFGLATFLKSKLYFFRAVLDPLQNQTEGIEIPYMSPTKVVPLL